MWSAVDKNLTFFWLGSSGQNCFCCDKISDKYLFPVKFITGLPNPVGICVSFVVFFLFVFIYLFIFFFSVSVKVLPVTPLLSGVFVHRVFCGYFVRFEGARVIRRFP